MSRQNFAYCGAGQCNVTLQGIDDWKIAESCPISNMSVNGYQLEKQCQKNAVIFQIYKYDSGFVNKFTRKSLFQKELRKN
jgi:hypothetical protein